MKPITIVDRATWEAQRRALLTQEKEFTRFKDKLSAMRREMPWVKIDQDYRFETERGKESLLDLFEDKHQLLVYHFMFGPDWKQGCKSCSFWADNFNGNDAHFGARDVSFKVVSLAPLNVFTPFKERMGWSFDWVSSAPSNFNYDFHVSFKHDQEDKQYNFKPFAGNGDELPGISAFARDGHDVYHTYSAYGRGVDLMNGVYNYLDLTPKGRDENELAYGMEWLKLKDSY